LPRFALLLPSLLKQQKDSWRAFERWTSLETFLEHYGTVPLKVTEIHPIHGMGKPLDIRIPLALYKEFNDEANAGKEWTVRERERGRRRRRSLTFIHQIIPSIASSMIFLDLEKLYCKTMTYPPTSEVTTWFFEMKKTEMHHLIFRER
jgi:hypothetical protein